MTVGARTTSSIALSWTNPGDADLAQVVVRRAPGGTAPATATAGTGVVLGSLTVSGVTDTGLSPGSTYSYSLFTRDHTGNTTTAAVSVTTSTLALPPADTTAPGPVTDLTVGTPTTSSLHLAWTNPVDGDFAGVVIRRATGATAPARPTDGDPVVTTAAGATSFTDGGLAPGTTYSYAVFARMVYRTSRRA